VSQRLRVLNDEGIRSFAEFIAEGALGDAPLHLLENPETSAPCSYGSIVIGKGDFPDRYQFGIYLRTLFSSIDAGEISGDRYFWTSLALLWFDRICPLKADGTRKPSKEYYYILSTDYRHYYRHLIRTPWFMVCQHNENARLLLIAPKEHKYPLSVHGEIMEQIGGRQRVLGSKPLMDAINKLYFDTKTGRPRRGLAGRLGGSANRLGIVLRQLELTYDPDEMPNGEFLRVLPREFDRWKRLAGLHNEENVVNTSVASEAVAVSAQ
jgi:hypothetical protein